MRAIRAHMAQVLANLLKIYKRNRPYTTQISLDGIGECQTLSFMPQIFICAHQCVPIVGSAWLKECQDTSR